MGDEQVGSSVPEKKHDSPTDAVLDGKVAEVPPPALSEGEATDSIFGEFLLFLKEEKKWWLAPLVVVLLLLSAIIMFAEGSAIAPFIYTIF